MSEWQVFMKKARRKRCIACDELVRLKGFEPPTYWFVASHSIQLSYSRIPKRDISLNSLVIIAPFLLNCKSFFLFFCFFPEYFSVAQKKQRAPKRGALSFSEAEISRRTP